MINLSPLSLPEGIAGAAYSQAITASGGTVNSYTFDVVGGALPAGLTLTAGGALSGTPAVPGEYPFTLRARDTNLYFGTRDYQLKDLPSQHHRDHRQRQRARLAARGAF